MFRTELQIPSSSSKISLKDSIFLIGSCFSTTIGELLQQNKFNALVNPFGTLFNPISINKLLRASIDQSGLSENGFNISEDVHFHYDLHSEFSSLDKNELINKAKTAFLRAESSLKKSKWLIITWGTAIVYEIKESNEVVANCHKTPSTKFEKRLLTQKEILSDFKELYSKLPGNINILLTVSPVRHIKETIELNSVSKSTLRIASHSLATQHENVHYFPSYELMMDDLRDYRFYKSDMLHPNEDAINYIWGKFTSAYFDSATLDFLNEWSKIRNAIDHKPFHPHSEKHQQFVRGTLKKLEDFSDLVDVTEEINQLNAILKS